MAESKKEIYPSEKLIAFKRDCLSVSSKKEGDALWNSISTPFIEKIPGDMNHCLVTFLYRQEVTDSTDYLSVYLHCDAAGLPFSENTLLKPIPKTDIYFLSLVLPSSLRTAYTLLEIDNSSPMIMRKKGDHPLFPYPKFTGELKKIFNILSKVHEDKKVTIDKWNPHKISYLDYNDPSICFATESILELPDAPEYPLNLFDTALNREQHFQLMNEGRFLECLINFSETSLKDVPEYQADDKNDIDLRGTRKYWIYLPPNYNANLEISYPFFLFLDGSDYLGNIPTLSILEDQINSGIVPPCIAVFFDYSPDRRLLEYYGDEKFTYFLTHDLIQILKDKYCLRITDDSSLNTLIGFSASGLAALYAGLTYPTIFGNVITQSAALWSKKMKDLEKLVDKYLLMNTNSYFLMEAGMFENVPLSCQFMDGDTQALSINQSNKELIKYMLKNDINVTFHEFVGGHNYVCWRYSLIDRLKELCETRFNTT